MSDIDRIVRMLRVSESDPVQQEAADALEAQAKRVAELEQKIERLSNKKIISTDVTRERIYNAISAWTRASDTVCSCATEAIIRIINDHFGG